jgi:hypothetical protein
VGKLICHYFMTYERVAVLSILARP